MMILYPSVTMTIPIALDLYWNMTHSIHPVRMQPIKTFHSLISMKVGTQRFLACHLFQIRRINGTTHILRLLFAETPTRFSGCISCFLRLLDSALSAVLC